MLVQFLIAVLWYFIGENKGFEDGETNGYKKREKEFQDGYSTWWDDGERIFRVYRDGSGSSRIKNLRKKPLPIDKPE